MPTDPRTFFRFAADHYLLLVDLFYRREGVNDAELLALIRRHRGEGDATPAHVADQLLKLGILEAVPDATASYEMTRQVSSLLGFLLLEHRLTSAAVIQGYLDDLEQLGQELEGAMTAEGGNRAARVLAETGDLLERIRQDSRANREGIIAEVLAARANRERRSVRQRFEGINRLWERYLEPLRDLIDVRKAMDQTLEAWERRAAHGVEVFALDGAMSREFARIRARLLRLRRTAGDDFREALREVEPLYQSLRRESQIVRGASRALERIGKQGLTALGLPARLALPVWRREGLFADSAAAAFLADLAGYEPQRAPALAASDRQDSPQYLDPEAILAALSAQLPVNDVMAWLLARHGDAPLGELLRAFGRVHRGQLGPARFAARERSYRLPDGSLTMHPMSVESA